MFKKILIANRGEIALRLMRTCREMGIQTVAVYSDADRKAPHVRYADEAFPVGPAASTDSYLRIDRIIEAARRSHAQAIHPGYGFLSENPGFTRACQQSHITFIGPPAEAMELMGSKTAARQAVARAGLPVVPGTDRNIERFQDLNCIVSGIGYPVMLKAAAGGGGKGMRLVRSPETLESAWRNARSEARNAFDDSSVYVEKYIERPRHIEIQILGDQHGSLIHLGERECSLQRRHQKVVEECPSPVMDSALRWRMGETAVRIGKLAGYVNAGTVEFLVDEGRHFYFLEMNTRLQVEHPVTEMAVGLDLVREQIRIAAGEKLSRSQEEIEWRGAALECRIYAEDPANNFFPSPGLITMLRIPSGPGVRDDSGIYEGWTVPLEYDPLLSKLIVWAPSRAEAIARMRRALDEYEIGGIQTNISFFRRLLAHPDFLAGRFDTGFLARLNESGWLSHEDTPSDSVLPAMIAAALHSRGRPGLSPRSNTANGPSDNAWKRSGRFALLNNWPRSRAG
jgi:acetyl-CoA carboxylase biotin carboxylase subunit